MLNLSHPKILPKISSHSPELPDLTLNKDLNQDKQIRENAIHASGQNPDLLNLVRDEESQR